jgi:hypothetical protein
MVELPDGTRTPYVPYEKQEPINFTPWTFMVVLAGQRSGKTLPAAMEVVAQLGVEGTRGWIVAPTYDLTDRCFEFVYDQVVINEVFGAGSVAKASFTDQKRLIEMKWGSWVKGKTAENPKSLVGDQLDYIIFDECAMCEEEIWLKYLSPRILNRKGWCLFITSPRGFGWSTRYHKRGESPNYQEKGWASTQYSIYDNPYVDKEWVDDLISSLPDDVVLEDYLGVAVRHEGLAFSEYIDELYPHGHLYDPSIKKVPEPWTAYRAVDIGIRNFTSCVWAKVPKTPANDVWITQDYKQKCSSHDEHAKAIVTLTNTPIARTILPADAKKQNGTKRGQDDSAWKIYRQNGIFGHLANRDIDVGISICNQYFKSTLDRSAHHPGILINVWCEHLREELLETHYKPRKITSTSDDAPEQLHRKNIDTADAFRYLMASNLRWIPQEQLQGVAIPQANISRARVDRSIPRGFARVRH